MGYGERLSRGNYQMLDQFDRHALGRVKALILSKSGVGRELPCLALVSRALSLQVRISRQMHLTRMARAYPWQEQEGKDAGESRVQAVSAGCVDIVSCFTRSLGAALPSRLMVTLYM